MWKERAKKGGKILLGGAIWVYVLSIPVGDGELAFDRAYDVLVQNNVVGAISRESKAAWKELKAQARTALADSETEVPAGTTQF